MENWEIVSIESELDRMQDEKKNSAPAQGASSSNFGCIKFLLWFVLGMVIFSAFIRLLNF